LQSARGKADSHGHGVNEPAEDLLESAPTGVALEKLLDGLGLFAVTGIGGVEGPEDVVDGFHEDAMDAIETACGALRDTNKIVYKDVDASQCSLTLRQERIADGRLGCCRRDRG
jgi:hypothetical protein